MKRLPGIGIGPRRVEGAVFGCLALAGLAVIALALSSSVNSVGGSDASVARGGNQATEVIGPKPCNDPGVNLTNFPTIETRAPRLPADRSKV